MRVGVPREIKIQEHRVGLVPSSVRELVARGHEVIVEQGAGTGIGEDDAAYQRAGAQIAATAAEVFSSVDLIVKVKEPQPPERRMLRGGQTLFTYLHLAADEAQMRELVAGGATCIAYETVTSPSGGLPLLTPMSEVAGRMAVQAGAHFLEKAHGGRGILLGGIPGVEPAHVAVIGGGVVGANAIEVALGMGARVTVLDRNPDVLRRLAWRFGPSLVTVFATRDATERVVVDADLLVGCVLVPGATAPRVVGRELIRRMRTGAVAVDVAIDQGGCFETSRPTTHADPTYVVDGVVHYCVANMPGAVPRTSAHALNNATLPYVLALADKGIARAIADDPHLRNGVNICNGKVTCKAVADSFGVPCVEPQIALAA